MAFNNPYAQQAVNIDPYGQMHAGRQQALSDAYGNWQHQTAVNQYGNTVRAARSLSDAYQTGNPDSFDAASSALANNGDISGMGNVQSARYSLMWREALNTNAALQGIARIQDPAQRLSAYRQWRQYTLQRAMQMGAHNPGAQAQFDAQYQDTSDPNAVTTIAQHSDELIRQMGIAMMSTDPQAYIALHSTTYTPYGNGGIFHHGPMGEGFGIDRQAYHPETMAGFLAALYAAQNAAPSGGGGVGTYTPTPPAIGTVQDGYRFNGGDPGDPNSWSPAGGQ